MNMGNTHKGGFTIVETLIVLAVTGALFISAAVLISNRQAKTQFSTSVQSVKQQMQQIINETASGYFPEQSNFSCSGGGSSYPTLQDSDSDGQGTNSGCVFMGKVLQFAPHNAPETYKIYTLAGNRHDAAGNEATTLTAAKPQVVDTGGNQASFTHGITIDGSISGSLDLAWMKYISASGGGLVNTGTVGFLPDLSQLSYDASSGNLNAGNVQLALYSIGGTAPGDQASTVIGIIDNTIQIDQATTVQICLAGGLNQSAKITIGSESDPLAVSVQIYGGLTCS